jgi:hypothetical protein
LAHGLGLDDPANGVSLDADDVRSRKTATAHVISGANMKDVLTLATFATGALGFALFVTTLKPHSIVAVVAPAKADYRQIGRLGAPGRSVNVLAAIPADFGRFTRY